MYWREKYPTAAHAAHALKLASSGRVRMSPADFAVAQVAARSELGSLTSFFKKAVGVANKLSPSHQLAKALKVDKFSPSQILAQKIASSKTSSAPKSAPALNVDSAPASLPSTAAPVPYLQPDFSFGQGGGGGSGIATQPAAESPAAVTEGVPTWVWIAAGAAALFAIYAISRK